MEKKKLTVEELQEFQANRGESEKLAAMLGQIHYQKVLLEVELEDLKNRVVELTKKQQKHLEYLGEKYGNSMINPQTGEITDIPSN